MKTLSIFSACYFLITAFVHSTTGFAFVALYQNQKIKGCNEWRGPTPLLSAWATQLRRNFTTVASRWRHCANLTGPGMKSQTSRTNGVRLTTELTGRCSQVRPEKKELDCFTRKASKGRFLLLVAWVFYLQLACGPQRLCKTE